MPINESEFRMEVAMFPHHAQPRASNPIECTASKCLWNEDNFCTREIFVEVVAGMALCMCYGVRP